MSTTLTSTLTTADQSFNDWRRNTNKTTMSVGDLSTIYTTDGAGADQVSVTPSKYIISSLSALTYSNGVASVTTVAEHNLNVGDVVIVSGCSVTGYNGTVTVNGITNDKVFTYALISNPGASGVNGNLSYQTPDVITSVLDLNSRKVKRTGDSIAYLKVTDTTASTNTTTGALIVSGGTGIAGRLNVGGNTAITGTLAASSDFAINGNKFNITGLSGNTAIAGTLSVADITDGTVFSIATNKFTVNGANGNTLIAGSLGVSGALSAPSLTLSTTPLGLSSGGTGLASMTSKENYILGANATATAYEFKQIIAGSGIDVTPGVGSITLSTNGTIPAGSTTDTSFKVGQQLLVGSLQTAPSTHRSLSGAPNIAALEIRPGTGVTYNWLMTIATDNIGSTRVLTVDTSGNISGTGTLTVNNNTNGTVFTIGSNKLTVNGFNGNTAIAGTLGVSGTTTLAGASATSLTVNAGGSTVTLAPAGSTGTINNIDIGGTTRGSGAFTTLTSNGATTLTAGTASTNTTTGTLVVTGGIGVSGAVNIGGNFAINGNVTLGDAAGDTITMASDCMITTYALTGVTGNQTISTANATTYQSVEFIIQGKDTTASNFQTIHILAVSNGSTINTTEFGSVVVGTAPVAAYSVDYNSSNFRINITPNTGGNTCTYKVTGIFTKA